MGVIFCGYESCVHGFVYSTVRGITSFITTIRRYGRLVTERKRKIFDLFAVSVMKDKEIHSTYFNSAIITQLKEMDYCARRAAIEQLKFLWIHKIKNFCGFTKMLFSQMTK